MNYSWLVKDLLLWAERVTKKMKTIQIREKLKQLELSSVRSLSRLKLYSIQKITMEGQPQLISEEL